MMADPQRMAMIQSLMQRRDPAGTSPEMMQQQGMPGMPLPMPDGLGGGPGLSLGGQDQAALVQMMGGGGPMPGEGAQFGAPPVPGVGGDLPPGLANMSPQDIAALMQMLGGMR